MWVVVWMDNSYVASLANAFWLQSREAPYKVFGAAFMFGCTKETFMGFSGGVDS